MADQKVVEKIEHLAKNLKDSVGMQYDRVMGFRREDEDDPNSPENLRCPENLNQSQIIRESKLRENAAQRMRRSSWSVEAQ